jgi:hypothetical protein
MEILGAEKLAHYSMSARGKCYMSFTPNRGRFTFSVKMMKLLNISLDTLIFIGIHDENYHLIISKEKLTKNQPLSLVSHGRKAIGFSSVILSYKLCNVFELDSKDKRNTHLFIEVHAREITPGVFAHLISKEI